MAQPRPVLAGTKYLITRRCAQRTFRLRPHPGTDLIFEYCLALAAQKTGVRVHAAVVMSNHHHLVVTDVRGQLPDFLRELHRTVAKAINASQGQWENLWAVEQTSAVALASDEDVIDKLAYLIANPVNAGLVRHPAQWPGVLHWQPGIERKIARSDKYFRAGSPEEVTLRIKPVEYEFLTQGRATALLQQVLEEKLRAARKAVRESGLSFMGPEQVMQQYFLRRATSYEEKRGTNPRFAAKHGATRCVMIRIWRRFTAQYREALESWRAGRREVGFPLGTWAMRVHHGAGITAPT